MLRVHEIEYLNIIAGLSEQLRRIRIHFGFTVGQYDRFASLDDLEQRVPDDSSGLHGTGCTEDGNVTIESRVFRHTNCLSLILTENCSFGAAHGRYLQHFLHLFFIHPVCRTVDTTVALGKASRISLLTVKPIVKSVHQINDSRDNCDAQDTFESVACESKWYANQRVHIHRFHHCLSCKTSGAHPD